MNHKANKKEQSSTMGERTTDNITSNTKTFYIGDRNYIRRGLELGVDNFEHTGLTTAPEYPDDVIRLLKERTAKGRVAGGPLYWTPTVEGLWNYQTTVANPEYLDNQCWHRGLEVSTHIFIYIFFDKRANTK